MNTQQCFGAKIWTSGLDAGLSALVAHAKAGLSGYACFANAHMVGESGRNTILATAMGNANWVFPDGRPVAAFIKLRGARRSEQIPGPEMTELILREAAALGLPVYLYGGTEAVLSKFSQTAIQRFKNLNVTGTFSPPFRPRTQEEELEDAVRIRSSGARICLVALGCPKQEIWMFRNAASSGALCLGVGAAFPMISGDTPRAPAWVRRFGMEWIFRWIQEPKRLTSRYTIGNLRFCSELIKELTGIARRISIDRH